MKRVVIGALLFCFIPLLAWPSSVVKIKGDRALIAMDGEQPIAVGQTFFTVDSGGKKRSIIKIVAIKENRAVGQILKGKSAEGHLLLEAQQSGAKTTAARADRDEGRVTNKDMSRFGVLMSYLINNMAAKFTLSGQNFTSNMKGTGVGALGYYDFQISDASDIRLSMGIEQFQVAEDRTDMACDGGRSNTCNAIISYFSTYGLYKYKISNGATKIWLGLGGGMLFAISKQSTVLDSSQISTNAVMTVSSGAEFSMKRGQYLPIVIEYSIFPQSSTVNANYIAIRGGWGWR